jgi:hypothetical protein
MVKIVSKDNVEFEISEFAASKSKLFTDMIGDDFDSDQSIPMALVDSEVFTEIIKYMERREPEEIENDADGNPVTDESLQKYCQHYKFNIERPLRSNDVNDFKDIPQFYRAFAKTLHDNPKLLVRVINAANYLDMGNLVELTCATMACLIKKHTPENLRKICGAEEEVTASTEATGTTTETTAATVG